MLDRTRNQVVLESTSKLSEGETKEKNDEIRGSTFDDGFDPIHVIFYRKWLSRSPVDGSAHRLIKS